MALIKLFFDAFSSWDQDGRQDILQGGAH